MADNKKNKNRHEFNITVDGEKWASVVNKSFEEARKNTSVSGFRKGKVPKDVFDKKVGSEGYLTDAASHAVSDEFTRIMKEEKYQLVAEPQIHITTMTNEKLVFDMVLIEQPEVNVKKYTGLKVKKVNLKATDEEVEHELGHLLERYAELVDKETDKVENGDTVIMDFEGSIDGVKFDGGSSENFSLEIGSGSFIPGFEEQMVGMKKEKEKEINVTFPEDYHAEELKGKKAVFKVKVHEIKVKKNRELDEEFFEDLGLEGVNSEKSLKEEIRKSIQAQKDIDSENEYVNKLIDEVCKNTEVDIPEEMVFDTVEMMFDEFKEKLAYQGISFEVYQQFTHQGEKEVKDQMEKEAFSRVLARLTLEYIKDKEKITVTDEEVDKRIKDMAEKHKMSEENIIKQFGSKDALKYDIEMNKVIDFLKEANK